LIDLSNRNLLLAEAVVLGAPSTLLGWISTAAVILPGLEGGHRFDLSFLIPFVAASAALAGFWVLVSKACFTSLEQFARARRLWWVLAGVGVGMTLIASVLVAARVAGTAVPDELLGLMLCLFGLPVLIPLAHLRWLRTHAQLWESPPSPC
jgi:hypothetical protein